MVVLGAAVAIVGVLCVLNLLLTFGVVRRLREHTEMMNRFEGSGPSVLGLTPGMPVAAFSATATDGTRLAGAGGLLVAGFFSSLCSVCPERVGPFATYVRAHQIARENAICVLTVTGNGRPAYADELAEVSTVCVEGENGEVARVPGPRLSGLLPARRGRHSDGREL